MEKYYEQSVAASISRKNSLLYGFCWAAVVILAVIAMFFAANAFQFPADGGVCVDFLSLILCVLCIAAACGIFVRKDYLRMEYDYILNEDTLEICGVMNRRRRKTFARIHLSRVLCAGAGEPSGENGTKKHKWYAGASCHYIIYNEDNTRRCALFEPDERLCGMIRRQLPAGAWRNE